MRVKNLKLKMLKKLWGEGGELHQVQYPRYWFPTIHLYTTQPFKTKALNDFI